ncbi:helix-turn-helix domain-containing protein [Laribacter hongkongensis]|nr:helix-turn-helix domain-containing protein [Laribacter hongkongensis]
MSIRLMSRAWDMNMPTSQKMVLLALADRANDDGECWPGQAELATKCSMSPRNVIRMIEWLEARGALRSERRQTGNARKSNRYVLTLDGFNPECDMVSCDNLAHDNLACDRLSHPNVTNATVQCDTLSPSFNEEPSMNHQSEPSLVQAGVPQRRAAPKREPNPLNVATWNAYAAAYHDRYGVEPVRNATVNGQIAQFVKRLGENAPHVAAHYVSGNSAFYTTKGHSVGLMLADAEKLHTEWATGRRTTSTAARQADRQQSNLENGRTALELLNAKYGRAAA